MHWLNPFHSGYQYSAISQSGFHRNFGMLQAPNVRQIPFTVTIMMLYHGYYIPCLCNLKRQQPNNNSNVSVCLFMGILCHFVLGMLFHFKNDAYCIVVFWEMCQYLMFYSISNYSQITILYPTIYSMLISFELMKLCGFNQNHCFIMRFSFSIALCP